MDKKYCPACLERKYTICFECKRCGYPSGYLPEEIMYHVRNQTIPTDKFGLSLFKIFVDEIERGREYKKKQEITA